MLQDYRDTIRDPRGPHYLGTKRYKEVQYLSIKYMDTEAQYMNKASAVHGYEEVQYKAIEEYFYTERYSIFCLYKQLFLWLSWVNSGNLDL